MEDLWRSLGKSVRPTALPGANPGNLARNPGIRTLSRIFQDTPPVRRAAARIRICPPADAEAVKEPACRDQLGTKGSAGGKLPGGKGTSRRPCRRASAAVRKALTNSA